MESFVPIVKEGGGSGLMLLARERVSCVFFYAAKTIIGKVEFFVQSISERLLHHGEEKWKYGQVITCNCYNMYRDIP